jgi:hypothetical protein
MPIEIKELHIRINVDETQEPQTSDNASGEDRDEIIEACVEQVMEILLHKEER